MTKLAPEWDRTSDPVIRSPAPYRWTTAPARKRHMNEINKKVSRALFSIKQVKNILPLESLRTLYFALIHPHLLYEI